MTYIQKTLSKLALLLSMCALALSAASSGYRLTLARPSMIGTTELKAGVYKIEMDGDKVLIKSGKETVETAAAKVETGNEKFSETTIRYSNGDGKYHIQEIRIGGTKTKLIFAN